MPVSQKFFISFLEETIQRLPKDFSFIRTLIAETHNEPFEVIRTTCTGLCRTMFGDFTPQLMKKDEKNFLIVAKSPDTYSVYLHNESVYKQKSQKVSQVFNLVT